MYLSFGEFHFQQDEQLLYDKQGLIALKKNQTALLSFLLKDRASIHSKDAILDAVWCDQDVSQQVVFQTICELRNILGNSAIKTFSKKGYRWNVPVEQTNQIEIASGTVSNASEKHNSAVTSSPTFKNSNPVIKLTVFALSLILIVAALWFLNSKPESQNLTLNLVVPNNQHTESISTEVLQRTSKKISDISFSRSELSVSASQIFASPDIAINQLALPENNWILWAEEFKSEKGIYLRYGLYQGRRFWQGYLYAKSEDDLTTALANRIDKLKTLGLFDSTHTLEVSSLRTMLALEPNDAEILLQLAAYYESTSQYDVALSYLQRVIKLPLTPINNLHHVQAHWKTASTYKLQGQFGQANHYLNNMALALEALPIWPLYFEYVKAKTWLAYEETHYQTMIETLNEALTTFDGANISNGTVAAQASPFVRFQFHILYSILAKKTSDETGKYRHLSKAQALLLKHELDESNLAVVLYHFALFAHQELQFETQQNDANSTNLSDTFTAYLNRIFKLPRTADNGWVHDAAFDLLIQHYVQSQRFSKASELFKNKSLTPRQLYLYGELHSAQQQMTRAKALFEQAFDEARIKYDKRTSVDAALKLYLLAEQGSQTQMELKVFLENNTSQTWLTRKLNNLNSG